jgi:hypothetical protein
MEVNGELHAAPLYPLCLKGWLGPGLDAGRCEEEENDCPRWELKAGRPARNPSLYRLCYPGSYKKRRQV